MYYIFVSASSDVSATPYFCKGETIEDLAREVFVIFECEYDSYMSFKDYDGGDEFDESFKYENDEDEEDSWGYLEIDDFENLKYKLENNKRILKKDIEEISIYMDDVSVTTEKICKGAKQLVKALMYFIEDKAVLDIEEFSEIYEGEIADENLDEIEEAIENYFEEYAN